MSNLDNLVNTYEGRPGLSELEAELLWEYAKTAALIKDVSLIRQITGRFRSETHTCRSQQPRVHLFNTHNSQSLRMNAAQSMTRSRLSSLLYSFILEYWGWS
jgi:hypothetical protein